MVTIRNYIAGEALNWSAEDIGWQMNSLEPESIWIVFVDGRMEAMLIGAKVMNSLLLVRLLGGEKKAFWLRPLWREVRAACRNRNIVGFWSIMDNCREPERKLMKLLQNGRDGISGMQITPTQGLWVTGRF